MNWYTAFHNYIYVYFVLGKTQAAIMAVCWFVPTLYSSAINYENVCCSVFASVTHSCPPSERSHDGVHTPHHRRGRDEREREGGGTGVKGGI